MIGPRKAYFREYKSRLLLPHAERLGSRLPLKIFGSSLRGTNTATQSPASLWIGQEAQVDRLCACFYFRLSGTSAGRQKHGKRAEGAA